MNRREFLKKAGIGGLAAASLPVLADTIAFPDVASAHGSTGFYFVTVSFAAPPEAVILTGAGRFSARDVHGGGSFTHFQTTGDPPRPIIANGRWRATKLISFTPTDPPLYGSNVGGILEMTVRLYPKGGTVIRDVKMEVVCNVGPGGLLTGEEEGVILTVPGAPFGSFAPGHPPVGITAFTESFVRI